MGHATALLLSAADWGESIRQSRCVLELGAGLGLPALACKAALGAQNVVITDRAPQVIGLLEENIERNFGIDSQVSVTSLDWNASAARQLPQKFGVPYIDVVLCCDCILDRLFGATEPLVEFWRL